MQDHVVVADLESVRKTAKSVVGGGAIPRDGTQKTTL